MNDLRIIDCSDGYVNFGRTYETNHQIKAVLEFVTGYSFTEISDIIKELNT